MSRTTSPKPLRGVNLGGWLVLEKWMTPSLFADTDAVDEYTFMQTANALKKIEKHRQTFITEADFAWLAQHGINAVRIPVGYWVLKDDPPYVSAVRYLDWAMDMAKKYSLQVIIDVHGLPGSQNGRDHSGKKGQANWVRSKHLRIQSIDILEDIARRYRHYPNLWGLQIINELKIGLFEFKLRAFYRHASQRLSTILQPHTRIIFSDAFTPRLMSGALKRSNHPVAMDIHSYHMTTPFSQYFSIDWFFKKLQQRKKLFARLSKTQPIIIGEWSGVLRGESLKSLSKEDSEALFADYINKQKIAYADVAGWFYWSYKTEDPSQWNYRHQAEKRNII